MQPLDLLLRTERLFIGWRKKTVSVFEVVVRSPENVPYVARDEDGDITLSDCSELGKRK